jgi:predicted metal-dependent hydrolase
VRATKHYLEHKERARTFVRERLEHYNAYYRHNYKKVTIRAQRSRWGSCSKKGNLNFNYRIVFLPEILADLVVVHELCHLKEFNHSRAFWALVAQTIPEYATLKKMLATQHPYQLSTVSITAS